MSFKSSLRTDIQQANVDMLREIKIEPSALANGYTPVMAYIGTEGYLVNLELRAGKQHCQKETPDFLKRNPRKESKQEWLDSVKGCCTNVQDPRDGKTVYVGQIFRFQPDG